jgi:Cytochrome oxidase complex assembly protein 1
VKRDFEPPAMRAQTFRGLRRRALLADMSDPMPPQAVNIPRMPWGMMAGGAAVVIVPLAIALAYFAYSGTHPDASMKRAIAAVQSNAGAQASLGQNIAITGWPTFGTCHDKFGTLARYAFSVRGTRSEAAVNAAFFTPAGRSAADMKSVTLTAADGTVADIVGNTEDEAWLAPSTRSDTYCKHQT